MTQKRALVCALLPEYDRDSGSRRTLHLVESLLRLGYAVSFVSHHAKVEPRYVRALQRQGVATFCGATEWVERLAATGDFEVAMMGPWHVAEPHIPVIRQVSPETHVLIDSVDLHFLRATRRGFLAAAAGGAAMLPPEQGGEFVREMNTYAAADAVLTVSDKEAELLADVAGDAVLAAAVPDSEPLPPPPLPGDARRGIVFVGCFRHEPNVHAITWFFREILGRIPRDVLERHPLYVVGDGMNEEVAAIGNELPFVRMVGWVPSVQPYFSRARVSVVPLLYGAGTKRKVIEALGSGTPTVCTRIGAEGLALVNGEHALLADEPGRFADAVALLVRDDEVWGRLSERGRAHVAALHGHTRSTERLAAVLQSVLSRRCKTAPGVGQPVPAVAAHRGGYKETVQAIKAAVCQTVPANTRTLVVSKGDEQLVTFDDRDAWHFPQGDDGRYAGHHPADSRAAVEQLESLRARGCEYLVLPSPYFWWLDHYQGLARHLREQYGQPVGTFPSCKIYRLAAACPTSANDEIKVIGTRLDPPAGPKLIAFYLPQFHPIPENDRWWGNGFTEWTNVAKARPFFAGHDQPHLPADLGFYDLRLPEVRERQAELARRYGIHGFCYYHYWFGGRRLLERPFNEVLRSGSPDFPFCLCWANEPWSRRWDGSEKDVLQPQTYGPADDMAHIRWLLDALADPRAIRINGKPVFIVYQGKHLPDPARTTDIWRREVERTGLPGLYLVAVETGWDAGWDATTVGFDAKVLFQPQFSLLSGGVPRLDVGSPRTRVFDYDEAWPVLANPEPVGYPRFETVFPRWDNTPRKGEDGWVLHNSTPRAYQRWLELAIGRTASRDADHQIVFINAWNEWAEGCHLEPDQRHGQAFLEATAAVINATAFKIAALDNGVVVP